MRRYQQNWRIEQLGLERRSCFIHEHDVLCQLKPQGSGVQGQEFPVDFNLPLGHQIDRMDRSIGKIQQLSLLRCERSERGRFRYFTAVARLTCNAKPMGPPVDQPKFSRCDSYLPYTIGHGIKVPPRMPKLCSFPAASLNASNHLLSPPFYDRILRTIAKRYCVHNKSRMPPIYHVCTSKLDRIMTRRKTPGKCAKALPNSSHFPLS